jgi:hypothetical protein
MRHSPHHPRKIPALRLNNLSAHCPRCDRIKGISSNATGIFAATGIDGLPFRFPISLYRGWSLYDNVLAARDKTAAATLENVAGTGR